jgi:phosphatidylglycerol:prolipoprotein diacylglycerol transferase
VLPELFKIPFLNFTLNTYGLLLALSFITGLWLAARLAKRDGIEPTRVYDVGLFMLLAQLVGSKLLMVITEWHRFADDPSQLVRAEFLRSGGVYYGGFLAAVSVSFYLAHRYKISWWSLADVCAPGIAVGQFIGRLGCFSAGCCWGKPTNGRLGVLFTERAHELTGVPIDVHLHPVQLYESGAMLIVTGMLLLLHRHRQYRGQVILAYGALYSVTRFIVEFYRDDPRGSLFGLSTSQLISAIIGPLAIAALIFFWRKRINNGGSPTGINNRLSEQMP